MDDFRDQVREGFTVCKYDITTLSTENQELKERLNKLENENSNLKLELFDMSSQIKGIEIAMKYIKDFNNTNNQNAQINESVKVKQVEIKQDSYEALLAFKAKSNKREVLKQKLISMVGENGINLSELKFLFVDHYKYCSKATFYNYIKELEYEKYVIQNRENHKSVLHLLNSVRNEM